MLLNNARSTVCPTKWAAVALVFVESSMRFSRLKDRISWFTPSTYIVSDLYAVYNAYDVLHVIKQPSPCWTTLIMFSGRVFPPNIARGKRSRIRNHTILTFTCLKHANAFINYEWSFKYEMKLKSATIFTGIYVIHYDIVHLASVRNRVSFSIHKPISDVVSMLLLK